MLFTSVQSSPALRFYICLVSKLHSPVPEWWWKRSLRLPPLENNSHMIWLLIHKSTINKSHMIWNGPCLLYYLHPQKKNLPSQNIPKTLRSWDLSVGFPEIFAMYWYSGMPPYKARSKTQQILVICFFAKYLVDFKVGSLHKFFLRSWGRP